MSDQDQAEDTGPKDFDFPLPKDEGVNPPKIPNDDVEPPYEIPGTPKPLDPPPEGDD